MTRRNRTDSHPDKPRKGRGRKPSTEDERKDRVIQTRVPKDLESTLKDAAERKRMTVSHLIRNVLEDTFRLVDGIVADSSALVENVVRDARKLAATAQGEARPLDKAAEKAGNDSTPPAEESQEAAMATADPLGAVDAWQDVIVNRPSQCASCGVELVRGQRAFRGLVSQTASVGQSPALWLCPACIEKL
ncbi:MAG TPA: hypothetical protein VFX11_18225 [Candidatus Kapabacteria bacterium]|nr:hypothetical protein [Candidatus Kapabacteria bacterium]